MYGKTFNPNRLKQARIFSNLADAIDTTKQAISQYSKGKSSRYLKQFLRLSTS